LGRQGPPVHQEQNAAGQARLHQPIDLVDRRERLARARGHRQEPCSLALGDGLLGGGVCGNLVGPQPRLVVRLGQQPLRGAIEVERQSLSQGLRGVEGLDLARAFERVADVVKPDDLAIGRVE
jgi:hypothetical protein